VIDEDGALEVPQVAVRELMRRGRLPRDGIVAARERRRRLRDGAERRRKRTVGERVRVEELQL
jgi:hypothetical protein